MVTQKRSLPSPPIGVIEALSAGFDFAAGHWLLLALPILLDMLVWMGPRISYRPPLDRYPIFQPVIISQADPATRTPPRPLLPVTDQYLSVFIGSSLLSARVASPLPFNFTPPVWRVTTGLDVLTTFLLFLGGSLLLWGIYLGLIAQQISGGAIRLVKLVKQVTAIGLQLALVPAVLAVFFLFAATVIGGFGLILGILFGSEAMETGMAILLIALAALILPWVIYLIFTLHGMFMNERNIVAAMWDSVRIVQWNMFPTAGLLALTVLIGWGLRMYVWELADPGSWLEPVAILGNAFIMTALLATSFTYFKDRHRHWREMRAFILAEIKRASEAHTPLQGPDGTGTTKGNR